MPGPGHLRASAASLDEPAGLLLAVNAGSDSISVFGVDGDRLHLNQVVSSGGPFPVSLAVSGSLAYVLDAGLAGSVSGYTVGGGRLAPIRGPARSLRLANGNPPAFLGRSGLGRWDWAGRAGQTGRPALAGARATRQDRDRRCLTCRQARC